MAKKSVLKAIQKRAATLPMVMEWSRELHLVKGIDLLEQGQTEIDGVVVLPDGTYPQWMPVKMAINHYRRMKDAYAKQGLDGIRRYEDSIAELLEQQQNKVA